jgi:FKBP-type peptidyl-prolyl cis-trans isomerase
MRERWIKLSTAMVCSMAICAGDAPTTPPSAPLTAPSGPGPTTTPAVPSAAVPGPTTRPAPTTIPSQATPVKHEPVSLPPPPTATTPAPAPAPVTTQAPVAVPTPTPPPVVRPPVTQPIVQPVAPPAPQPPTVVKPTTQPGPIDEKVAYAIGRSVGQRVHDRLMEDGRTADDLTVLKGFIDGLSDKDSAYSRQEVQAAFAEFQAYTQQHRAEKMYADVPEFRKKADENLQKSRAVLDQNAEMAGVEVRPDGVQVQELIAGNRRVVANAKIVTVKKLRVSLADGTLVNSTEGDQIEKIDTADALPALMDAVRAMRVGTKCRIWLPPDKAYGLTGKPPEVGPNEAIEYEFELVGAE